MKTIIKPVHGYMRAFLLPVYGVDQVIFVLTVATTLVFLWMITDDTSLISYLSAGAYIGFIVSMFRSTPSKMYFSGNYFDIVKNDLDSSPYLVRVGDDLIWERATTRIRKWSSDLLNLSVDGNQCILTGRYVDLIAIRENLGFR